MNYIIFLFKHLLDLPKTIWINCKVFEFKQALRLPILISRKVKVAEIHKGVIVVPEKAKTFSVKIGIEGADGVAHDQKGCLVLKRSSKMTFCGKASISRGILIRNTGKITFGKDFYSNCNLSMICAKDILFGNRCVLGWNVHIRDCDGHPIFQNGERINLSEKVSVGNHVWIGQDVKILKGTEIPTNSVVAMNSCLTKKFSRTNTIIGGYPAKIIKQDVNWEV
ncbi:hypothetical protein [uncultured Eubacterium sp.]|uniref:acyltransferase n=1 Tax=uncultured Eubacterium sp. TaxID=165185 RepID=UPI0026001F96|nr:hypothetical protein [uncultured Eubacterium sp.]